MLILGIESSCDETAAAVAEFSEDGKRRLLSDSVASQIAIHRLYGGVVPEIASRAHSEAICRVTEEALSVAGVTLEQIDAIGVTNHPGLIGALLVGVNFAKGLAFSNGKPLVPVNHIKGHIAANYYEYPDLKPPFLALVVSGGHTSLIHVRSYTDFETIGRTRDDAAGEAFDKIGRVMGLTYPCGAEMDKLADIGDSKAFRFPSAAIPDGTLDFSFSGMKTAVLNTINSMRQKGVSFKNEDIAASFTHSFTASITKKLHEAIARTGEQTVVIAGGVSANSHLRDAVGELCSRLGVRFCLPPRALCGDNGAMIAAQAYYEFMAGNIADTSLNAEA
ncbi:MAG: tRNA (adenosine(37)-N6)-threonylcarbamoyltransferase complex transferase subunit TsaD [Clostridia bacterium]|nr:tRNA (adenosine(37)-N6)-threonylcarbamoyltransferase complex transferase subunit TsaD [Clostridia bacterium]